jgi:hypothetical protein
VLGRPGTRKYRRPDVRQRRGRARQPRQQRAAYEPKKEPRDPEAKADAPHSGERAVGACLAARIMALPPSERIQRLAPSNARSNHPDVRGSR